MPPGVVTAPRSSSAGCFCVCCAGKMRPRLGDTSVVSQGDIYQLISESFLTVKGAALFLPRGNGSSSSSASRFSQLRSKHAGDIQQHLQTMFTLLRPEDNIKLAVRLESIHSGITRYMVVVSTNGRQDTEESVVLGMDFSPVDSSCSVGLVLPLWSDTLIHLDGDGGFSVSTDSRVHVFKPVSVQAMWSALQSLHKACDVARCHNYFPGSLFLTWVSYYQSRVSSDQVRINEWNTMRDLMSHRADSPVLFSDAPTERELTERQIKTSLKEIMMQKDLENVTCKEIRTELEMHMTCNLREFKEYIDNEMIVILGQMDSPTEIFDYVFLGSEWNASNLEELQNSGVQYILNVTREIDNFFPGVFEYHNIRVYDEEATDLLAYWNDTYKFITRAKKAGSKCLVHCKMGISRSAATVIAYAMKEFAWDLKKAFDYVKERRAVTKPNPSFMRQLEEYQGILLASRQRHNKLWRSHSDSDLSEHHEPLCKSLAKPHSLGRSDPHNQASSAPGPSVKELLESLGTSARAGKATRSTSQSDTGIQSNQLSSSSFQGVAALSGDAVPRGLEIPRFVAAKSRQLDPPRPESTAGSASPLSPPLSNGLCDAEEPPSSPPLSQPRAATVVPEPQKTDTVTVAQSVSVDQPHPPPSLHHLPLSPAPSPACTDEVIPPEVSSCPQPVTKKILVSVPEPMATQTPSTLSAGPQSLSVPVPVKNPDCDQQLCGSSLDGLAAHPPSTSDFISYPSAIPQDGEVLVGPSADHINFFSAREKFKGMSQDGKTPCAAVQQSPQVKSCAKEQQPQPEEVSTEEEKGKELIVPVQATGLKAAVHTEASSSGPQPQPQGPRDQEVRTSMQEMEDRNDPLQKEAENVKEEVKNKEDDEEEEDSARLYNDWTRGSVRRVTRQLEQKMKMEHETPTTSSSSPPSLSGGTSSSQRQAASIHPVAASQLQDASDCSQESFVSTEQEEQEEGPVKRESGDVVEIGALGNNDRSTKGHKLQPADGRLLSTSYPSNHFAHSPFASVNFLCLEGVTELESGTDWDCSPEGPHSDIIMRETWETLCELGAFLQQVSTAGAYKTSCVDQFFGLSAGSSQKRSSSIQKRVREVEARIRQAGLTPPSLMKRSASLAKLGCLELLANDLSEWELSRSSVSLLSEQHPVHTGDESKKQRVHNSPSEADQQPEVLEVDVEGLSEAGETSTGIPPPSYQSQQRRDVGNISPDSLHSHALSLIATRQPYGRTHPLRRLKKRTVSNLYHTM
ncbi:protein phosphatase Slingshot homolog 2b isoform X1 [Hippoglossus stenolepis]|uniref:protein phosphatase Slingshot homolog 2b isoform X1 n=1 Tax=Hippoglossus stenolepis TaxID=195615 RepID=UPI001FAF55D0|nr:protein phosphatase Slingshot homolog 2b isoform X1 [Hippoglossus stenolepis]